MDRKTDLSSFGRMVLEDERLKTVLADLKDRLATGMLNTELEENHARDDFLMTWKGAEAFLSVLQSYVDEEEAENRGDEAKEEELASKEKRDELKQDALKDL